MVNPIRTGAFGEHVSLRRGAPLDYSFVCKPKVTKFRIQFQKSF